jgi:hypothetical protein
MSFVAYLIAVVLFLVAGFDGGVEASYNDFVTFALAFFTLGHIFNQPGLRWPPSR